MPPPDWSVRKDEAVALGDVEPFDGAGRLRRGRSSLRRFTAHRSREFVANAFRASAEEALSPIRTHALFFQISIERCLILVRKDNTSTFGECTSVLTAIFQYSTDLQ